MKLILAVAMMTLAATPAWAHVDPAQVKAALESQQSCQSFVRFDDQNVYIGNAISVKVIPLTAPNLAFSLITQSPPLDAARVQNSLWILTEKGLEQWDITHTQSPGFYPTTLSPQPVADHEQPTEMAVYGNDLVISHGRLGFSIFDTVKKTVIVQSKLLANQAPKESMATGVAITGDLAYFVLDNFTLSMPHQPVAFRGIVVVDLKTGKVVSQLDGMDPGATAAVSDNDQLIVSFWGNPIWKYGLTSLSGNRVPEPQRRVWEFPVPGHPTGVPSLDEQYYYTCYLKAPASPSGHYTKVPLAISRKDAGLD